MKISTVREENLRKAEHHLKMAELIHEEITLLTDLLGKMNESAKSTADMEYVRAGIDYVESLRKVFRSHMDVVKSAHDEMEKNGNTVVYVIR